MQTRDAASSTERFCEHYSFVLSLKTPLIPSVILVIALSRWAGCQEPSPNIPMPPVLGTRSTELSDSLSSVRERMLQQLSSGAPVDVERERDALRAKFPGIGSSLLTTPEEVAVRMLSREWKTLSDPRFQLPGRELARRQIGLVQPRQGPFLRSLVALVSERRNEMRNEILAGLEGADQARALLILDAFAYDEWRIASLRGRRDSLVKQGVAIPVFVDIWIGNDPPFADNAFSMLLGIGGFAGSAPVDRSFESGPSMQIEMGWMRRSFWVDLSIQPTWGDLRRPISWRGHVWEPSDDINRLCFEFRTAWTPRLSRRLSIGPMLGWGSTEYRDSSVAKRDGLGKEDRSIYAYPYHLATGASLQFRSSHHANAHGLIRIQGGRRFSLDDPSGPFSDRRWFFEFQTGFAMARFNTSGLHP